MNYTYLLECADGSLYCGWTNDPEHRLRAHNAGKGGKYTRSRRPVRLVYLERFETKQEAMQREYRIKHMSRAEKLSLISTQVLIEREKQAMPGAENNRHGSGGLR